MELALQLAERGRGFVEPNPLVGAVIVREERLIAEGWHQRFGEAHAEVNALDSAGDAARGSTLYVTLEPCCHFGKTPPCTQAVIAAGVRRLVAAMRDPFPQVAGRGESQLREAGIEVTVGLGEAAARKLNQPYLKLLQSRRPHVHAKWAMTLDGKIAARTGDSKWISGERSRQRVHELRGRMDAIIVGVGTVLADDPMLTARPPGPRIACRVVLDSHGRLPASANLGRTADNIPTLVFTGPNTPAEKYRILQEAGCELVGVPADATGRLQIDAILLDLGRRRMTNVLVEGGAEVLGSFFDAHAVDEWHVFVAPRIAGGRDAPTAVRGLGVERIADALRLEDLSFEILDGDVYIHGRRGHG